MAQDSTVRLKLEGHEDRLQRSEDNYAELKSIAAAQGERVEALRDHVDDRLTHLRDHVDSGFSHVGEKFDELAEILKPLVGTVQAMDTRLKALEDVRERRSKWLKWAGGMVTAVLTAALLAFFGLE